MVIIFSVYLINDPIIVGIGYFSPFLALEAPQFRAIWSHKTELNNLFWSLYLLVTRNKK